MAALIAAGTLLCLGLWLLAARAQETHGREALWQVVHSLCVPDQVQRQDPAPCSQVNLTGGQEQGFAILKDLRGASQYLLVATARISGIESPALLAPMAPNYFADAWEARSFVNAALHRDLPREDISLAINSAVTRSQDQFHIHIDCVRGDVQASLYLHRGEIAEHWAPFPGKLAGHRFMARWVAGVTLGANNPLKLLAEGVPGAKQDMGDRTLVVVGAKSADGKDGFVILEGEVNRLIGELGSGEDLQDHACLLAAQEKPAN